MYTGMNTGMKVLLLALLSITSILPFSHAQALPTSIDRPVLYQGAEKLRGCLEGVLLTHTEDPGNIFSEWRGPGVRASSGGDVDPSTALFIFQMMPSDKWYAIAFYSQDDTGWQLFSYHRDEKLQVGYRARSMERTGYLFRVAPRSMASLPGGIAPLDDTLPYTEVDLSICEDFFKSWEN
ncbi:MAG: hypothetical protein A2X94_13535 [Bdellovibrionales bacterium GWB1_55_8]|nr:MAG: hypothetical protein A2X94_13535 [Bdellovibrionales bacterium GWB1_55_8]